MLRCHDASQSFKSCPAAIPFFDRLTKAWRVTNQLEDAACQGLVGASSLDQSDGNKGLSNTPQGRVQISFAAAQ